MRSSKFSFQLLHSVIPAGNRGKGLTPRFKGRGIFINAGCRIFGSAPVLGRRETDGLDAELCHVSAGDAAHRLVEQLIVHSQYDLSLPALQVPASYLASTEGKGGGG